MNAIAQYSKEERCELLALVLEEKARLPPGGNVYSICHADDGTVPWGIDSVDDFHMTSPHVVQDGTKGLTPGASGSQLVPSALAKWVVVIAEGLHTCSSVMKAHSVHWRLSSPRHPRNVMQWKRRLLYTL